MRPLSSPDGSPPTGWSRPAPGRERSHRTVAAAGHRAVGRGRRAQHVAASDPGSTPPRCWMLQDDGRWEPSPPLDPGVSPVHDQLAARLRVTAVCSVIPRRPTVGVEPDTRSCKAGTWILGFTASPTARSVALTPAPARQLELKWRRPATMRSRCGPGPSRFRSFLAVVLIRASVTRRSRLVLVVQLGDDVVEPAPRTRRANRASAAARRPRNPASAQARSRRTRRRRWQSTQPDDHDASR